MGMQSGAEESHLSFDFVAGHSKGQEQLFRGDHPNVDIKGKVLSSMCQQGMSDNSNTNNTALLNA